MTNIFISRLLASDSIFAQMLPAPLFRVHGETLVQTQAVAFDLPAACDWIFFYSRQGVHFFFENPSTKHFLLEKKAMRWAAIGEATAKALRANGVQVDFVGNGNPSETAMRFLAIAKHCAVLFPQALHSEQSIEHLLEGHIRAIRLPVYENIARKNLQIPFCEALVFTSPLNATAYFQEYSLQSEQTTLAIGHTTAQKLADLGVPNIHIADQPSELALAQKVISLFSS